MAQLFDLKRNPDIDSGQYTPNLVGSAEVFAISPHIGLPWYWNRVKNTVEVYGYASVQMNTGVEPAPWAAYISLPDTNYPGNVNSVLDLVGNATPEHATKSFIIFGPGYDFGNGVEPAAFINAGDAAWADNYSEAVEVFFSYRLS